MASAIRRYEFERITNGRSYRDPAEAARARDVFLARIGAERAVLANDAVTWELLLEHATEYPLNIEWYERSIEDLEEEQRGLTALTIAIVVLGVGAAVYLPLQFDKGGLWAASASLVLGGFLAAAKLLAQVTDRRSQLSSFWEASSNLKEALFSFEHAWRDKAVVSGAIVPAFRDALVEHLRLGRAEARKERAEFFKNLRSPTETIGSVEQAIQQLRDKLVPAVASTQQASAAAASAAASRDDVGVAALVTAARKRVVTAAAREAAAEAKLRRATELGDATVVAAAEKELGEARLEIVAARAELEVYLRSAARGT